MKQRPRIYFSDSQKALMWKRWKQGWTLHQIAQLFDRGHTSVQGVLARTGGIQAWDPALFLAFAKCLIQKAFEPVRAACCRSVAGRWLR
jgi:hypothetical protein